MCVCLVVHAVSRCPCGVRCGIRPAHLKQSWPMVVHLTVICKHTAHFLGLQLLHKKRKDDAARHYLQRSLKCSQASLWSSCCTTCVNCLQAAADSRASELGLKRGQINLVLPTSASSKLFCRCIVCSHVKQLVGLCIHVRSMRQYMKCWTKPLPMPACCLHHTILHKSAAVAV